MLDSTKIAISSHICSPPLYLLNRFSGISVQKCRVIDVGVGCNLGQLGCHCSQGRRVLHSGLSQQGPAFVVSGLQHGVLQHQPPGTRGEQHMAYVVPDGGGFPCFFLYDLCEVVRVVVGVSHNECLLEILLRQAIFNGIIPLQ